MSTDLKVLEKQIFDYLLEYHFRERAAGREFYFIIGEVKDDSEGTYFRHNEQGNFELCFWKASFGVRPSYNLYVTLNVTDSSLTVFALHNRFDDVAKNALIDCFPKGYEYKDRLFQASYQSGDVFKTLELFIQEIKPKLDEWVEKYGHIGEKIASLYDYGAVGRFYAIKIRPEHFDEMLSWVYFNKDITTQLAIKGLPRSFCGIEIRNYKGIEHTEVWDIPANTKWIFLTGQNGFGKSSILKAIAIGLRGISEGSRKLLDQNEDPVIFVNYAMHGDLVKIFRSKYQTTEARQAEVVAYGTARLQENPSPPPDKRAQAQEDAVRSLFDGTYGLLNIEYELITANAYQPEYFTLLADLFYKIIPDLHEIRINVNHTPFVEYIEKDTESGTYNPVRLDQLAAGLRSIIAFVGDMLLRLSAGQDKLLKLSALRGIVIIDELELHLHPKYQKMLPGKLSELFPNVQFIASTHSPIPLLGAPKETIILHVNRSEEEGITVEKLDVDIHSLLPNALLTSPVFGFDEILPSIRQNAVEIETEDDYKAVLEMTDLKRKLKIMKAKMNPN